jgi:hypothetical protein
MNYRDASIECARYIFDNETDQEGYEEYIKDGNDPREHILYCAAIVLGEEKDFQSDIDEYLKLENN